MNFRSVVFAYSTVCVISLEQILPLVCAVTLSSGYLDAEFSCTHPRLFSYVLMQLGPAAAVFPIDFSFWNS
jgi:hypothetical protein